MNLSPAFTIVSPSYIEPATIVPYAQSTGAFATLYDGQPQARLSEGDLFVYVKRIDIRTRVAADQSAYNSLPSVSTAFSMMSSPTYMQRVRAEYDHHDTAAMGRWGMSIVEVNRLGMRQGHFQSARNALLYGFNPANGEGLVNTQGALAVSLPPDPYNQTTVLTYDNGAMAVFLLAQVASLKTRTNQLGQSRKIVLLGPQRILGAFEYQNIVQLTSYQRAGGGSVSTAEMVDDVLKRRGDDFAWVYDDTLMGKGAGGTDLVLMVMPEVKKPGTQHRINTNEFANLQPGFDANTLMYCEQAAPVEIPTPLPGGAIDTISEWRITPGWGIRPETIVLISMPYGG